MSYEETAQSGISMVSCSASSKFKNVDLAAIVTEIEYYHSFGYS